MIYAQLKEREEILYINIIVEEAYTTHIDLLYSYYKSIIYII
jgi:hypothetical protein